MNENKYIGIHCNMHYFRCTLYNFFMEYGYNICITPEVLKHDEIVDIIVNLNKKEVYQNKHLNFEFRLCEVDEFFKLIKNNFVENIRTVVDNKYYTNTLKKCFIENDYKIIEFVYNSNYPDNRTLDILINDRDKKVRVYPIFAISTEYPNYLDYQYIDGDMLINFINKQNNNNIKFELKNGDSVILKNGSAFFVIINDYTNINSDSNYIISHSIDKNNCYKVPLSLYDKDLKHKECNELNINIIRSYENCNTNNSIYHYFNSYIDKCINK